MACLFNSNNEFAQSGLIFAGQTICSYEERLFVLVL